MQVTLNSKAFGQTGLDRGSFHGSASGHTEASLQTDFSGATYEQKIPDAKNKSVEGRQHALHLCCLRH
jgi:hypothetical protein